MENKNSLDHLRKQAAIKWGVLRQAADDAKSAVIWVDKSDDDRELSRSSPWLADHVDKMDEIVEDLERTAS